jgi:phytoene synthase
MNASTEEYSRESIKKGSLSFHLASLFFDSETRKDVRKLYAWCRYVDDITDGAAAWHHDQQSAVAELNSEDKMRLLAKIEAASDPKNDREVPPAIAAFREVCSYRHIPLQYAAELFEGMRMDLRGQIYGTYDELKLYCYRVAGVVGLMMSYIMTVSSKKAHDHAADLGIAMQLTNIARDIRTDAKLGRVYLPAALLNKFGLPMSPRELLKEHWASSLAKATKELLSVADVYYESGSRGVRYLPLRAAIAVASASAIYREIGIKVQRLGASAWDERVSIGLSRKIFLAARATSSVLFQRINFLFFRRLMKGTI